MLIPLRAGALGLWLGYDLQELADRHGDLNRALEEAWAGVFSVLAERWPDWPIELWTHIQAVESDADADIVHDPNDADATKERWRLDFCLYFAGETVDNPDVTAMVAFVAQGMGAILSKPAHVGWTGVDPDWKPLWVIDDGVVYRLLAPERTFQESVYLLGSYAGKPAWFAAAIEGWSLYGTKMPFQVAEADLSFAFVI